MDMDMHTSWTLNDICDFQVMINGNGTVTNMKDDVEGLSSKIADNSGAIMSEAPVGKDGGAVLGAPMTANDKVSAFRIKCEANNIRSPARGSPITNADRLPTIDKMLSPTLPCTPLNVSGKEQVTIKEETADELARSRRMPTQLLPPNLPSDSKRKLLFHAKYPKKDTKFASKRAFNVAGDHGIDEQVSEQPCGQPSTPMKTELGNLGCTKDENESKLVHPKSLGTHLSKVSCQTIFRNARVNSHGKDDSDLCIIEDRSEPSRTAPVNGKSPVLSQRSTYTEPINHVGASGVRLRANDERLVYRVVLQVSPVCLG